MPHTEYTVRIVNSSREKKEPDYKTHHISSFKVGRVLAKSVPLLTVGCVFFQCYWHNHRPRQIDFIKYIVIFYFDGKTFQISMTWVVDAKALRI